VIEEIEVNPKLVKVEIEEFSNGKKGNNYKELQ
jgi:hypothetical protein